MSLPQNFSTRFRMACNSQRHLFMKLIQLAYHRYLEWIGKSLALKIWSEISIRLRNSSCPNAVYSNSMKLVSNSKKTCLPYWQPKTSIILMSWARGKLMQLILPLLISFLEAYLWKIWKTPLAQQAKIKMCEKSEAVFLVWKRGYLERIYRERWLMRQVIKDNPKRKGLQGEKSLSQKR